MKQIIVITAVFFASSLSFATEKKCQEKYGQQFQKEAMDYYDGVLKKSIRAGFKEVYGREGISLDESKIKITESLAAFKRRFDDPKNNEYLDLFELNVPKKILIEHDGKTITFDGGVFDRLVPEIVTRGTLQPVKVYDNLGNFKGAQCRFESLAYTMSYQYFNHNTGVDVLFKELEVSAYTKVIDNP